MQFGSPGRLPDIDLTVPSSQVIVIINEELRAIMHVGLQFVDKAFDQLVVGCEGETADACAHQIKATVNALQNLFAACSAHAHGKKNTRLCFAFGEDDLGNAVQGHKWLQLECQKVKDIMKIMIKSVQSDTLKKRGQLGVDLGAAALAEVTTTIFDVKNHIHSLTGETKNACQTMLNQYMRIYDVSKEADSQMATLIVKFGGIVSSLATLRLSRDASSELDTELIPFVREIAAQSHKLLQLCGASGDERIEAKIKFGQAVSQCFGKSAIAGTLDRMADMVKQGKTISKTDIEKTIGSLAQMNAVVKDLDFVKTDAVKSFVTLTDGELTKFKELVDLVTQQVLL